MNKPERIGDSMTENETTVGLMLELGRKARSAADALDPLKRQDSRLRPAQIREHGVEVS